MANLILLSSVGFSQKAIAKQFNITGGHVCNIVNRKTWTFI